MSARQTNAKTIEDIRASIAAKHIARCRAVCPDYTTACRNLLDTVTCQKIHKVKCPVVDHRKVRGMVEI